METKHNLNLFKMQGGYPLFFGVAGGTLASIATNVGPHDLLRTGLMAAFGAAVSFFVSLGLRVLFDRSRKRK